MLLRHHSLIDERTYSLAAKGEYDKLTSGLPSDLKESRRLAGALAPTSREGVEAILKFQAFGPVGGPAATKSVQSILVDVRNIESQQLAEAKRLSAKLDMLAVRETLGGTFGAFSPAAQFLGREVIGPGVDFIQGLAGGEGGRGSMDVLERLERLEAALLQQTQENGRYLDEIRKHVRPGVFP